MPKAIKEKDSSGLRTVEVDATGTMTAAHMAILFGVSVQALNKWIDVGCPVAIPGTPGRAKRLRLLDVIAWRSARDAPPVDDDEGDQVYNEDRAKARDWHYRSLIREAQAHREIGALVPVDVIADVVTREYSQVRTSILSIPSRLATRLASEDDPAICARLITQECNRALTGLSSGEDVARHAGADLSRSIHDVIEIQGDAQPLVPEDTPDED